MRLALIGAASLNLSFAFTISPLSIQRIGNAEPYGDCICSARNSVFGSRSTNFNKVTTLSSDKRKMSQVKFSMLLDVPKQVLVTGASGKTGFVTFQVKFVLKNRETCVFYLERCNELSLFRNFASSRKSF